MPNPKPKALHRLSDIDIAELTLCKNPAVPAAANLVLKTEDVSAGKSLFARPFTIKSTDAVKKQVFLYFLVPDEPDLQGDVISADEVEKACHAYMKNLAIGNVKGMGTGYEHQLFKGIGYPIQVAIDYDGSVGKAAGCAEPKPGGWWVGIQCSDETWALVEKGEIKGGSIGGVATRTPVEGAEIEASLGKTFRGIIDGMLSTLRKQESGPVTFDEAVAENENRQKLWDITDALQTSIRSIIDDDTMQRDAKIIALGASIDQFKAAMLSFMAAQKAIRDIAGASAAVIGQSQTALKSALQTITTELNKLQSTDKAGQPDNGGNDMDAVELKKAIDEALKPLTDQVAALKTEIDTLKAAKPAGDPPPEDVAKKNADEEAAVVKMLGDLSAGIESLVKRIEVLEKKPAPRQGDAPDGKTEKSQQGAASKAMFGQPE